MDSVPLPLLVFAAEVCVVTLSTLRIIFIARGMRLLAPCVGFFEITLWLFAIGQIMKNLDHLGCFLGFAAGFTLGNYLGLFIEKRLALGTQVVRIITSKDAGELIAGLRAAGYGVTRIPGHGATGPVQVVLTVIQRRELRQALGIIKEFDARAFYSVEDVQMATAGVFPQVRRRALPWLPAVLPLGRRAA